MRFRDSGKKTAVTEHPPSRNGHLPAGIAQKLWELRTVQSCHYLNPAVSAGMYEVQSPGDQASP